METPLSSHQGIYMLCKLYPQKLSYVLLKLASVVAIIAAIWYRSDIITFINNASEQIKWADAESKFVMVLFLLMIIGSTGMLLYMAYLTIDAVSSLVFRRIRKGKTIYYHNGGFTRSSVLTKLFGTEIHPIDTVEDLPSHEGKFVFLNNAIVQETQLHKEEVVRVAGHLAQYYTEYRVHVDVTLKGMPVRIYTVTGDEEIANNLHALAKDGSIYVVGKVDDENKIDVELIGKVLMPKKKSKKFMQSIKRKPS